MTEPSPEADCRPGPPGGSSLEARRSGTGHQVRQDMVGQRRDARGEVAESLAEPDRIVARPCDPRSASRRPGRRASSASMSITKSTSLSVRTSTASSSGARAGLRRGRGGRGRRRRRSAGPSARPRPERGSRDSSRARRSRRAASASAASGTTAVSASRAAPRGEEGERRGDQYPLPGMPPLAAPPALAGALRRCCSGPAARPSRAACGAAARG